MFSQPNDGGLRIVFHLSYKYYTFHFTTVQNLKTIIQKAKLKIRLATLQTCRAWGMNGCRAESVSQRKCSTAFWVSDSAGGEDYPWWITSVYIVLWPVHNFKCVQLTVNRKTSCCCQQLWCCSSSTSQQSPLHLPYKIEPAHYCIHTASVVVSHFSQSMWVPRHLCSSTSTTCPMIAKAVWLSFSIWCQSASHIQKQTTQQNLLLLPSLRNPDTSE